MHVVVDTGAALGAPHTSSARPPAGHISKTRQGTRSTAGVLSCIYHEKKDSMPAKKILDEFPFDPATFNWEQFKAMLGAEIDGDETLTSAKITQLTETNTALSTSERDLKVRLFDATVMRQGTPVAPTDSPAAPAAGAPGAAPVVTDDDLFG